MLHSLPSKQVTEPSSPAVFFAAVEKVLKAQPPAEGCVQVEIVGDGWRTIDFGARSVEAGQQGAAKASVRMGAAELAALLNGKLNVADAVADARVSVRGEADVLERFALLLEVRE